MGLATYLPHVTWTPDRLRPDQVVTIMVVDLVDLFIFMGGALYN